MKHPRPLDYTIQSAKTNWLYALRTLECEKKAQRIYMRYVPRPKTSSKELVFTTRNCSARASKTGQTRGTHWLHEDSRARVYTQFQLISKIHESANPTGAGQFRDACGPRGFRNRCDIHERRKTRNGGRKRGENQEIAAKNCIIP